METTVLELTAVQIMKAADAVVERFGEGYVYNPGGKGGCLYVPLSDPRAPAKLRMVVAKGATRSGCFIGEILSHLGLMTDEIASSKHSFPRAAEGQLSVSEEVAAACLGAQNVQDAGVAWGRCRDILRYHLHEQLKGAE